MHLVGFHDRADLTVASGVTATIRQRIPEAGILQHVSAGVDAGTPPVRVSLQLNAGGNTLLSLRGGWVRGPIAPSRSADLVWDGGVRLPPDPRLHMAVRNDTGSVVIVTLFWAGESPPEEPDE